MACRAWIATQATPRDTSGTVPDAQTTSPTMRAIAIALIVVGQAACWNIPSYRGDTTGDGALGDDGGGHDGTLGSDGSANPNAAPIVSVTMTGSGSSCTPIASGIPTGCTVSIVTADYTLSFAPDKWRMPQSLMFNATHDEALGSGGSTLNDDIGLTINDSTGIFSIDDGARASMVTGTATLTIEATGPAVAQVEIDGGNGSAGCGSASNWRSVFTAYPDGRIVRSDTMNASPTSCDLIASFETIDVSGQTGYALDHVTFDGVRDTDTGITDAYGSYTACFASGSDDANFGEHLAAGAMGSDGGTQFVATSLTPGDNALRLANAWVDTTDSANLVAGGSTFLQVDARHSCATGFDPRSYSLPNASPYLGDFTRGLYEMAWNSGGPTVMNAPSMTGLPAGFAVQLSSAPGTPVINSSATATVLTAGVDYQIELVDAGEYFLWFRDGLSVGDALTFSQP